MAISVAPVSGKKGLDEFLRLPFALYRGDPLWVPPVVAEVRRTLDPGRNPYFADASLRLFMAYRDGTPAARLAVVVSRAHERAFGVRTAFFGFFESANDEGAARRLFDEAEAYCRAGGVERLEGPFNPHHYSELGLQADMFGTAPSFFQAYNPGYYGELLGRAGFRVSARFLTMKNDDLENTRFHRFGALTAATCRRGYSVRPFSLKERARDLGFMREINNDAFAENWHFLPLSPEEYEFSAQHMGLVTRPGFIRFVEHHGRPVAVLHCVLDVNPLLRSWNGVAGPVKLLRFLRGRRTVKTIILFTAAIKKEYRRTYVSQLLLAEFCRLARGFERAETTWMSPDNLPALRAAESLGMRPDKHFAMYAKELRP
ncbi:MAG TPA: hypothetical protein PLP83_05620 [Candidatus Aminicenantes bacterium]|nr:hypothetical protein [Candidatus Aminicenantes bacterium]